LARWGSHALVLLAAGGLGCRGSGGTCPEWQSPCPRHFDVDAFCKTTAGCRIDGVEIDSHLYDVHLARGQVLQLPVAEFASAISDTRDFFFRYTATGRCEVPQVAQCVHPQPANVTVLLDGVPGTHGQPSQDRRAGGATSVRWTPFPSDPQLLDLSYADGNYIYVGVEGWFEDSVCEDENPAPICDL
jgi:hypothetical protein